VRSALVTMKLFFFYEVCAFLCFKLDFARLFRALHSLFKAVACT